MLEKFLNNQKPFLFLFCSYILIVFITHFIKPYFVYDEANFIGIASRSKFFFPYPYENFGQIFWIFLKFLFTPIFTKFIFLLIWIVNVIILINFFKQDQKLIIFIFLISCPFVFWNGKIVSPDTLGFFFCSLSLYFLNQKKYSYTFISAGLAIGIKVSFIPIALFIFLYYIFYLSNFKLILILKQSAFFFISFFSSNPTSLFELIKNILHSSNYTHDINHSFERLLGERWEWDVILANGFFDFFISLPSLIIIFISIFLSGLLFKTSNSLNNLNLHNDKKVSLTLIYFISISSVIYLVFKTNTQYVWYWFCLIPITFFYFSKIFNDLKIKYFFIIFFSSAVMNIILNFDITAEQIVQKFKQKSAYYNFDENMQCLGNLEGSLVLYEQLCLGCYDQFQDWKFIPNSESVIIGKRFMSDKLFYKSILEEYNFYEDKICQDAIILRRQS